jgi:hypothetical protein
MVSQVKFDRWQNTLGTQYSNIIQAQFTSWSNSQSITTIQAYTNITSGVITVTPLYTNTRFMIIAIVQGYLAGVNGANVGINRTVSGTTTRILGVDGTSGDTWIGAGDGNGTNSYTICRHYLDSPSVVAGTPVTYQLLAGVWSGGGTMYINYPGYSGLSSITVFEVQT